MRSYASYSMLLWRGYNSCERINLHTPTRLQSGVDFATQDMEQEALFESQLLPLVISNHSWTKTCQAFMCFEVNSHANKPYCHFSGHFVTFVSLILTIAQPLLNMFQQDLQRPRSACPQRFAWIHACPSCCLEYLLAALAHHWTSKSRVFSENWSKHLVFS